MRQRPNRPSLPQAAEQRAEAMIAWPGMPDYHLGSPCRLPLNGFLLPD
jgi:hypothetical protein